MSVILRDYQNDMLCRLNDAWRKHRSVMVQMPTGTGKTVLLAEVIRQHTDIMAGKVLIVAHRRELIEQICKTLMAFGIRNEKLGMRNYDYSEAENVVVVESIQKLSRLFNSPEKIKETNDFQLVIVDEAHHALAKTYRMLWEKWPKARFLGMTATPCRLSGEPLSELFDVMLQSWSIQEFIDKGWLSDFEYVSAAPDSRMVRDVRRLSKRSAGDYQEKEMATVMDVPESIEHLYKTYRQFADRKKGIVYAINREHALHISEYYRSQGVRCEVIDSKTPTEERNRIVEGYRTGKPRVDVLVNVDIFGEGFDVPEVEFIQLARPTLSMSKYLQQVGRGMRVSKGKPHVLILDNVGLYQTFGLPTEEHDWQRMFMGKEKGKGHEGRIVLADNDKEEIEKELVNLEMVRIKKGGRKGAGLEVFMQGRLYGVMMNGKVTCPAKFKQIVRVDKNSQFYALGVFNEANGEHNKLMYAVDIFTVISKKGQDMGARLYGGSYYIDGDFVQGERMYDDGVIGYSWWDSKTGRYYSSMPEVKIIHGMEFSCVGKKGWFRQTTGMINPEFGLPNLYYNRSIALDKFHLVVRKDNNHAYKICGYLDDSIIVQNDREYGYLQIFSNGSKGSSFLRLPKEMKYITDYKLLGVRKIGELPFV